MAPVRLWRMRSAAVAAMLLIFAATVFVLRQNQTVEPKDDVKSVAEVKNVEPPATPKQSPTTSPEVLTPPDPGKVAVLRDNRRRPLPAIPKRPTATFEPANTGAPVVSLQQSFPLDVSQPSYKVSLDDGRGSSRTISVPSVSFGSRRVLSTNVANPYAAKGDW